MRKLFPVLLLVIMVAVMAMPASAQAAAGGAYNTSFTTSITYQNVGAGTAQITITFFDQATGLQVGSSYAVADLAAGAGTSLNIGSVSQVSQGFQGSAMMSSNEPLLATTVQLPNSTTVKNRPLSNGFSSGSPTVLIASILKNKFDENSILSIQNVDSVPNDLVVTFYNADNPSATPIVQNVSNLPAGAAKVFDMGKISTSVIPDGFNGSATITATQTGSSADGAIVATVMELYINGVGADAFEGVSSGGNTYYMPSALCKYSSKVQISYYAVQNISTTPGDNAAVTVTYSNGKTDSYTIAPGTKHSFDGCGAGNPTGFLGSAVITSVGADIIAIGKVSGGGATTAFVGASSGAENLALPYVRWSATQFYTGVRQQTFIAIQNIGSDIPAGQVTVKYLDKNGVVVGTDTLGAIANGQKLNSTPNNVSGGSEFGYYNDGTYGGSAVVSGPAGSQLVVIARVTSYVPATGLTVAEDYNGIPFTPAN